MNNHKFRIGKNYLGWFVAVPQGWGGFHVIENVGSFELAIEQFNFLRARWGDSVRWM